MANIMDYMRKVFMNPYLDKEKEVAENEIVNLKRSDLREINFQDFLNATSDIPSTISEETI